MTLAFNFNKKGNMSKHTPGPWKWNNASGAGLQIYGQVPFKADCVEFTMKASEQPLFTLVAYEKWIQFPPKEWDEMQEANAALIAASPDLLEACKKLLRVHYDTANATADGLEACNMAEAAIAKANNKSKT